MPTITSALFIGDAQVDWTDWKKLSVPGFGPRQIGEFLNGFGWDGNVAANVGVKLSADNLTVENARLTIVGCWDTEPFIVQAQKLWPQAPPYITLEVELRDMSAFRFADGDMCSRYIPQEALRYKFLASGEDGQRRELADAELEAFSISPFSVRTACGLSKASGAKHRIWLTAAVIIYPATEEEMTSISPAAKLPAWPGIKLVDGDIPVHPQAGKGKACMNGKEWGCPIAPAVRPGAPWEDTGKELDQNAVTAAIGALLNKGLFADTAASADSLRKKWEGIQRAPEKLAGRKPDSIWPTTSSAAASNRRGNYSLKWISL